MMILSLVPSEVVDAAADPMAARLEDDLIQFGLESLGDVPSTSVFKDLGLVRLGDHEYYASTYLAPAEKEESA